MVQAGRRGGRHLRAGLKGVLAFTGALCMITAGCLSDSRHEYNGIISSVNLIPVNGTAIQNNTDESFSALLALLQENYSDFNIAYSNNLDHIITGKRIGMQHTTDYFISTIRISPTSISLSTNYSRDNSISVPRNEDFNATIEDAFNIDLNLTKAHNGLISSFIMTCYPVKIHNETYLKKEKWMNA